jgi:excisionase family DNA binding protein
MTDIATPDLSNMQMLKIDEACAIAKVSRSSVYEAMDSGRLAFVKLGRSRRIPESALREYLKRAWVPARCPVCFVVLEG